MHIVALNLLIALLIGAPWLFTNNTDPCKTSWSYRSAFGQLELPSLPGGRGQGGRWPKRKLN